MSTVVQINVGYCPYCQIDWEYQLTSAALLNITIVLIVILPGWCLKVADGDMEGDFPLRFGGDQIRDYIALSGQEYFLQCNGMFR